MHGELFTLQRAAFVDEAMVYGTSDVPSLTETITEFEDRLAESTTFAWVIEGRVVGAVSVRDYRPGGPDIERMMVAPDCRQQGIGAELVAAAERFVDAEGSPMIQLIVGEKAVRNRQLYTRLGFVEVARKSLSGFDDVVLLTMRKAVSPRRRFRGQVRLLQDDRPLGFVRVELEQLVDGTWGGLLQGSDYLMWGSNHQELGLEFPDGEAASAVVRATGRLRGVGPVPAALVPAAAS